MWRVTVLFCFLLVYERLSKTVQVLILFHISFQMSRHILQYTMLCAIPENLLKNLVCFSLFRILFYHIFQQIKILKSLLMLSITNERKMIIFLFVNMLKIRFKQWQLRNEHTIRVSYCIEHVQSIWVFLYWISPLCNQI